MILRWFERRQIYHPRRVLEAAATDLARPFEELRLQAADGIELHGWFFPAAADSPRAQMAVLVCHGNTGNISNCLGLASALLETRANVLVFDYRGYGRSQGRPSEEGTYLDAQAAYGWLIEKGLRLIVGFGESLGGGIVSELARRETLAGIVLQNTFCSIPAIGAELYPWLPVKWISTIKYDTCARLPELQVPVLVMHSREDAYIGIHHGHRNFATANEPKLFWELTGKHNEPVADRANFIEGMNQFLKLIEEVSLKKA